MGDLPTSLRDQSQMTLATARGQLHEARARAQRLLDSDDPALRVAGLRADAEVRRALRGLGPGPVLEQGRQPTKRDRARWNRETDIDDLRPAMVPAKAPVLRVPTTSPGPAPDPETVAGPGALYAGAVGQRPERLEPVAIGPEQIGEQVCVARVALRVNSRVARATGLHDVRMDRDHDEAGLDEGVDEQSAGSLDGDRQLGGLRAPLQSADQLRQSFTVVSRFEPVHDLSFGVDHADGVRVLGPVESHMVLHRLSPFGTLADAGRSYRWLIDGRSEGSPASKQLTGPLALLPVVGRDLPAPSRQRVSRGLSSSKRNWLSARRHREHRATLSRVSSTTRRVDQ